MHDVTNRSRVDVEAVATNARLLIAMFEDVLRRLGYTRAAEALPLRGSSGAVAYLESRGGRWQALEGR